MNFGDDVRHYRNIFKVSYFIYVKPSKEGKECFDTPTTSSGYDIHIWEEWSNGDYDNEGAVCEAKAYLYRLDYTGYNCNSKSQCYNDCPTNKVDDKVNDRYVDDPFFCEDYDYGYEDPYTVYGNKRFVQFELQTTDNKSKIYQVKKID